MSPVGKLKQAVGEVLDNVREVIITGPAIFECKVEAQMTHKFSRAVGVVDSHPLSMREALGSIPRPSIFDYQNPQRTA